MDPFIINVLLTYICVFACVQFAHSSSYVVDISDGFGRRFDGIGGLSGGGATSKLLVNYAEPYRSQILDYLFKPNFGASLQILKVEIGGDAQSTDGTESSHMHEAWDESYDRGYEWWLMVEAKKRNPAIKLYGLPWAFPGWVAMGTQNPFTNANVTSNYMVKWIKGAKKYYNLDIDYLGIWNERHYDTHYIKVLRDVLDESGLGQVMIVAADNAWFISADVLKDKAVAKAVSVIGGHYPGTRSSAIAQKTGKPLWSSEDYSTYNDDIGAGCWARILNQNYVNGYMTSTISWNLIASYYEDLPYGRDGLMTAQEPWSGHYVTQSPIWVTAHTTQFTSVGWKYLKHGAGVDHLEKGGSFVCLVDLISGDFTMVIETMSHNHSLCIRPALPAYSVESQVASFSLRGKLSNLTKLYVWRSKFHFDGRPDEMFIQQAPIQVVGGRITLKLGIDEIYTLTTIQSDPPKVYPAPPQSQPFPIPYHDNFEGYPVNSEAYNFVPQIGVWEVRQTEFKGHGQVNRQVMLHDACYWCNPGSSPINIGGNYNWTNLDIEMDLYIPSVNGTSGVFLGGRVTKGGCGAGSGAGIFFAVYPNSYNFTVALDFKLSKVLLAGKLKSTVKYDTWFRLGLIVSNSKALGFLEGDQAFTVNIPSKPSHGFAAYGATSYGIADYDNLVIRDR